MLLLKKKFTFFELASIKLDPTRFRVYLLIKAVPEKLKVLGKYKLLIIDEIGYLLMDI